MSFTIDSNKKLAIVGQTGAGKSTIINLLTRFYDPLDGRIVVNGYDLRDISISSLRRHMSIVLQNSFLFPMSIKDNIRFGKPDASDEATSSIDPYTELVVQNALKKLLENRLAIIIAHRLSTIRLCDEIIVLDQGSIVEKGTQLGLMKKGGMYSAFYKMQFRKEEGFEKASVASKLRTH